MYKNNDLSIELILKNGFIKENIMKKNMENEVVLSKEDQNRMERYIELLEESQNVIPKEIVALISENIVKKFNIMPIKIENNSLVIATSEELDYIALEDLKAACGLPIQTVIIPKVSINKAINKYYVEATIGTAVSKINESFENDKDYGTFDDIQDINNKLDSTPIVKFINSMIHSAYQEGASDIHIEPLDQETIVRIRRDGILRKVMELKRSAHESLINRLKIMGNMDIAERRIPQDGRIVMKSPNLDLRLSSIPTVQGEKMVIRLLGDGINKLNSIDDLNLNVHDYTIIQDLLKSPTGVILVTGPTGSGKSTTMYAFLNQLFKPTVNIITIEDPVERKVEGINQVQVNTKAGLTFASGLRSILRQDPDIIMIGEIRDEETAQIAVRASITGHLVLSTLHTNDTASTIMRLTDMGIAPYLVSSSLSSVIAQRLAKVLCPHCKKEHYLTESDYHLLKLDSNHYTKIYEPVGCPKCSHTGYKGRRVVLEIMPIHTEIRKMINNNMDSLRIKNYAKNNGMLTLEDNMRDLVLQGVTSMEEFIKIAFSIE